MHTSHFGPRTNMLPASNYILVHEEKDGKDVVINTTYYCGWDYLPGTKTPAGSVYSKNEADAMRFPSYKHAENAYGGDPELKNYKIKEVPVGNTQAQET